MLHDVNLAREKARKCEKPSVVHVCVQINYNSIASPTPAQTAFAFMVVYFGFFKAGVDFLRSIVSGPDYADGVISSLCLRNVHFTLFFRCT